MGINKRILFGQKRIICGRIAQRDHAKEVHDLTKPSLDAKREEFRKYLEKEGALEYLTKHLVPLYEKADKPTSALEYLKNNFAGKEVEEAKQKAETLESENRDLKKNVERLETEKNALTSEVADLITDKVTDKMDDDSAVTEEEKPVAE